jgi:hypothetical protein
MRAAFVPAMFADHRLAPQEVLGVIGKRVGCGAVLLVLNVAREELRRKPRYGVKVS